MNEPLYALLLAVGVIAGMLLSARFARPSPPSDRTLERKTREREFHELVSLVRDVFAAVRGNERLNPDCKCKKHARARAGHKKPRRK